MTKLTIICGPTAVGKTDFALTLAKKYGADLISVDSRQVYQGMNIGTGKDIPPNSRFTKQSTFTIKNDTYAVGYYMLQDTKLWLCDIARPNQPFSTAVYNTAFNQALTHINTKRRPVILIGGTGFYLKSIISPPDTMTVPPNEALRDILANCSVTELQERLKQIDAHRFEVMNHSDQANPRRLVRAIEVGASKPKEKITTNHYEVKWFGLTAPKDYLGNRIEKRVHQRINADFSSEVTTLRQTYPGFMQLQAGNTLGYQEWGRYLDGDWTSKEATAHWITNEIAYAKRQLTWFNKQSGLTWFDITSENWYAQASEQLERWMKYGTSNP